MNRAKRERNHKRDERYAEDQDREYGFKQTHSGRADYPGGEWGGSSEFGRNTEYREADSYDRRQRPFDMDNYYSGRQFSVGGVDFDRDSADDEFTSTEYNRSRFAEPYTGGQFSSSHYGVGSRSGGERSNRQEEDRYFREKEKGFFGKGPKGYKRPDGRIKEEVCEALFHSPIVDARDIEVTVEEGNVTLRGTVDTRMAKREAENCIEHLSGVEDVHNELRLKKGSEEDSSKVVAPPQKH